LAAPGACTLTSLGYLEDGGPVDGGNPSADGASLVPPGDATSAEASATTSDGGRWCLGRAPTPYFCADFDDGNPARVYVSGVPITVGGSELVDDGGTLTVDRESRSPPWALSFSHPGVPSGDGGTQYVTLNRPVSMPTTGRAHLAFDMRIAAFTSGTAELMSLAVKGQSGGEARMGIELNGSGIGVDLEIDSQGSPTSSTTTNPLPLGTWIHVDASIALGSPNTGTITFDVPPPNQVLEVANAKTPAFSGALTAWFIIGVSVGSGSGATRLLVDNVTLTQD
jgi:hypothetical protein